MGRVVPKKNYVILGIVIILTFFLMYYFYMWYEAYMDNKLNKSILDKYMNVINYNELDNYLVENTNTVLYISVLEDSRIRDFEKEFKTMFRKNKVNRDILYMDVTSDVNLVNLVVSKYSNGTVNDMDVPVIIVIEDGKLKSFYDVKGNNYEVDGVIKYIDSIKFLDEDELNG